MTVYGQLRNEHACCGSISIWAAAGGVEAKNVVNCCDSILDSKS